MKILVQKSARPQAEPCAPIRTILPINLRLANDSHLGGMS